MDEPATAIEHAVVVLRRLHARRTPCGAFGVLDAISSADPCTISTVAEVLHIDKSRASRLVAQAVEAGLVERRADQADGRKAVLVLTAEGRVAAEQIRTSRRALFEHAMAGWDLHEQALFGRMLTAFARGFEDAVKAEP